jgi:HEAT repeat protein
MSDRLDLPLFGLRSRVRTSERDEFSHCVKILEQTGILTARHLLAMLQHPPDQGPALDAALRVLALTGSKAYGPALLQVLSSADDRELQFKIAHVLISIDGRRVRRTMCDWLRSHDRPAIRHIAAYVLTSIGNRSVIPSLIHTLVNEREFPEIRGQAAEALGQISESRRDDDGLRDQIVSVLTEALLDPSPHVRFWCAFSLGELRAWGAIPLLENMASADTALCPNWWKVGDEAKDAIARIRGEIVPERIPTADFSCWSWEQARR